MPPWTSNSASATPARRVLLALALGALLASVGTVAVRDDPHSIEATPPPAAPSRSASPAEQTYLGGRFDPNGLFSDVAPVGSCQHNQLAQESWAVGSRRVNCKVGNQLPGGGFAAITGTAREAPTSGPQR